jgi:hypothetical protein
LLRRAVASGGWQDLDPEHLALSADRTGSEINAADSEQLLLPCLGLVLFFCNGLATAKKLTAQRDVVFTPPVPKQSEMPDSYISIRQNMEEESSDKLLCFQRHDLLLVTVGIVPPSEGNGTILKRKDTVIADGDSVGISAQILQDPLGPLKGRLAVDNPFLMIKLPPEALEDRRVFKMTDTAGEDKIPRFKGAFKIGK